MKNYCFILFITALFSSSCSWVPDEFNPRSIELNDQAVNIIEGIMFKTEASKENEEDYNAALQLLDESIKLDSSYYLAYGNKINILVW